MAQLLIVGLLLAYALSINGSPLLNARQDLQPVLTVDFPDPSILQDGNTWWAFATQGNGYHVQMASAPAPSGPWTYQSRDALPTVGAWSTGTNVWAPDVRKIGSAFVMYYSAEQTGNGVGTGGRHCIAAARASTIDGPYIAEKLPMACHTDQGGSIDPSGYTESDGTHWITWKVDGNSIGNGGNCNNGVAPIASTPIMLQQLAADGVSPVGGVTQILDRGDADGPLVEAPNIIKVGSTYFLFFSSNCYTGPLYATSYAYATNLKGPYTKSSSPLLVPGDFGLGSPGGATALQDGSAIVFHANCDVGRCMYEMPIGVYGSSVST